MKFSQTQWIVFSGALWLFVGILLLTKGLGLIILTVHFPNLSSAFFSTMASKIASRDQAALLFVTIGLLVGFMKGRFVLSKTVERVVLRIVSFPNPVAFKDVYTKQYYLLIGGMMSLGMLLKWIPIPPDVKGFIDVAIGSALINGAVLYFRHAITIKKTNPVR